jgi:mono/diheme cytochrome c family protein
MPPFAHALSDADIVTVVTFIRGSWGNAAKPVSQLEVMRHRRGVNRSARSAAAGASVRRGAL